MIDINLTGVWHTAKAAVPHLIAAGGGALVLTFSAAGLKAYAGVGHDVVAKHGVVGPVRTLTLELAPRFIRVNSIHPTQVDTDTIHKRDDLAAVRAGRTEPDAGVVRADLAGDEHAADPLGRCP